MCFLMLPPASRKLTFCQEPEEVISDVQLHGVTPQGENGIHGLNEPAVVWGICMAAYRKKTLLQVCKRKKKRKKHKEQRAAGAGISCRIFLSQLSHLPHEANHCVLVPAVPEEIQHLLHNDRDVLSIGDAIQQLQGLQGNWFDAGPRARQPSVVKGALPKLIRFLQDRANYLPIMGIPKSDNNPLSRG